jgi:hypothetical protein
LHFIDDKIALFDVAALEIGTEAVGLFVLRGITFSLATLRIVGHGVEVRVKLRDDLELAIHADKVEVSLFREIEIGDCFANLKSGIYEITSGKVDGKSEYAEEGQVSMEATTSSKTASNSRQGLIEETNHDMKASAMVDEMTDGHPPADSDPNSGLKQVTQLSPEKMKRLVKGIAKYAINETSTIHQGPRPVPYQEYHDAG